jgi:hypothetical protein
MALERVDYLAAALEVLAQQYRRPNFQKVVEVFARQFQELEDAAQQVLTERLLDKAVGEQISVLERIVGQGVFLTTDEVVRKAWIASRIKLNRSSGTGDDLLQLFALVLAAPLVPDLTEFFPAALELRVAGGALATNLVEPLGRILQLGKAAGVGAQLLWQPAADSDMLIFPVARGHMPAGGSVGSLSFALTVDAGEIPEISAGLLVLGDGTVGETFSGYDGYDGTTLSVDGYGELLNDYEPDTPVLYLGTTATDPGKGLGDANDANVGGQLAGAV